MGKFIKCWGMCVLLFVFWGGIWGGGGRALYWTSQNPVPQQWLKRCTFNTGSSWREVVNLLLLLFLLRLIGCFCSRGIHYCNLCCVIDLLSTYKTSKCNKSLKRPFGRYSIRFLAMLLNKQNDWVRKLYYVIQQKGLRLQYKRAGFPQPI